MELQRNYPHSQKTSKFLRNITNKTCASQANQPAKLLFSPNSIHTHHGRVAPFLKSLMLILNTEDSSIIHWIKNGTAFEIINLELMEKLVLPKYFRHEKFASFQRQLNYFGFKKWSKTKTHYCTYSHPQFVRENEEKLELIRRKTNVLSHSFAKDGAGSCKRLFDCDNEIQQENSKRIRSCKNINRKKPTNVIANADILQSVYTTPRSLNNKLDKSEFVFADIQCITPSSKHLTPRSSDDNAYTPIKYKEHFSRSDSDSCLLSFLENEEWAVDLKPPVNEKISENNLLFKPYDFMESNEYEVLQEDELDDMIENPASFKCIDEVTIAY